MTKVWVQKFATGHYIAWHSINMKSGLMQARKSQIKQSEKPQKFTTDAPTTKETLAVITRWKLHESSRTHPTRSILRRGAYNVHLFAVIIFLILLRLWLNEHKARKILSSDMATCDMNQIIKLHEYMIIRKLGYKYFRVDHTLIIVRLNCTGAYIAKIKDGQAPSACNLYNYRLK